MKYLILSSLLILFTTAGISCTNRVNAEEKQGKESTVSNKTNNTNEGNEVIHLNKNSFKELVFDYENNKEWSYNGKVPAILDFYADWCGPCKMLAPVLEELQSEYGGKIQVYKVNTDQERELASVFGIQSLPTIVFIPVDGKPQAAMGFRPKEDMENMITEILKVQK